MLKIGNNFYQYQTRVDRYCELVESLASDDLKENVSQKLEWCNNDGFHWSVRNIFNKDTSHD